MNVGCINLIVTDDHVVVRAKSGSDWWDVFIEPRGVFVNISVELPEPEDDDGPPSDTPTD